MVSGRKTTTAWDRLTELRLPGRVIALAGLVFTSWLLIAPIAFLLTGWQGVGGATIAAFFCLLGGEGGLLVAAVFRGPGAAMNGALVAMQVRMAIPLCAGIALHLASPWLAESGMVIYLLVFYLIDLAAETALLVAAITTTNAVQQTS